MHSAAKGPCEGIEGIIRAAIHTARDQDRGTSSRGERFSSPCIRPAERPSPQSALSHHGDAGVGQPLKMKRPPPPPVAWRVSLRRADPPAMEGVAAPAMPSLISRPHAVRAHLREAVGSSFRMRPPITAAHARCGKTVPRLIDRAAPPAKGCCLLSSPYIPSRESASRWFRPHASSRGGGDARQGAGGDRWIRTPGGAGRSCGKARGRHEGTECAERRGPRAASRRRSRRLPSAAPIERHRPPGHRSRRAGAGAARGDGAPRALGGQRSERGAGPGNRPPGPGDGTRSGGDRRRGAGAMADRPVDSAVA